MRSSDIIDIIRRLAYKFSFQNASFKKVIPLSDEIILIFIKCEKYFQREIKPKQSKALQLRTIEKVLFSITWENTCVKIF